MAVPEHVQSPRIITEAETLARTGMDANLLWAAIPQDEFPQPVDIHGVNIGFNEHEVDQWIRNRPRSRDGIREA